MISSLNAPNARCEGCGQLCVMDAAWTVKGLGKCCRLDNPFPAGSFLHNEVERKNNG